MIGMFEAVRSGQLDKALAAAEEAVRSDAGSAEARAVLVDVLLLRGDSERAESHLGALLRLDPSRERDVQCARQLIRADADRRQVFDEGRMPEFLVPPNESMRLRLGAIAHRRAGAHRDANEMLQQAAATEAPYWAVRTGKEPAPFTDWDSRFGATLEACSATGKYYWIPFDAIAALEFAPIRTLRDLAWRTALVTLSGSGKGSVRSESAPANVGLLFVPTRYPGSERSNDGLLATGAAAEWTEPLEGIGLGVGQRVFLHGEDEIPAVGLEGICAAPRSPEEASQHA